MANPKKSFNNLFFRPIESVDLAKKLRLPSLCLTLFCAVIWIINAFSGSYGYWAIAYSVVLSLIAWGLYNMRKEAAVVAMIVALVGLLFDNGAFRILADFVMLLFAVAAIRGTFAYSLLTRQTKFSTRKS